MATAPPSMFGVPALRSEDPRFLRGEGRYLDNIDIPGALHAAFVRSIMPHARLTGIDVSTARGSPGVVGVYVAADLDLAPLPPSGTVEGDPDGELEGLFSREPLARHTVRFVGEIVAVVVAETLSQAVDAAEMVGVEYEELPVVVDVESASADGAPLLWPEFGSNVAHSFGTESDWDLFERADVVVRGRFVNQRVAPAPMETNGIAVVPEEDGAFTVWVSTQVPFDVRDDLAQTLGVGRDRVRAIAPDVGGAFGAKLQVYAEYHTVAAIASRLGRPVRWQETRSESMVSLTHGRAQVQTVELGASRDGNLVGLRAEILADMGAYPIGAFMPGTTQEMLCGVYRIPRIVSGGRSVVTNTTPVAPYRGAGRPEATALIERAMDMLAAEVDMDPVDLRRRNFIRPEEFPHTTASGVTYDTGDYEKSLDEALRLAGYEALRAEQATRRARGNEVCLGIGVATYVEITAFGGREFAAVEVGADSHATVSVGTTPAGHGHETAFAQLASASLGIPFEDVTVVHSDTGRVARGEGSWGSRSLQIGGSSMFEQAEAVVEQGRELAAALLEVDAADVERVEGGFAIVGAPDRSVGWSEVARANGGALRAEGRFRQRGSTFPFGAHVAVVEVDTATGEVRLLRHVAVDDCGRILNPALVRGQQHGGLAQGIAQALFEEVLYDESGNPVTSTLATYQMPSAADLPPLETSNTETPTDLNPLGVKGIGESATIGSTPAVQNAVVDAVSHLGVRHIDLPLTPERVWRAIRQGPESSSVRWLA
ncbi:MAG: xanthine dehydrogenase family protein molybdopterin-binding subunit [Actinomycetota bacterium]|nr:xanthine dehydrogenase family protein molybdopterin-binding subunit [Actinomycetota bacterium]